MKGAGGVESLTWVQALDQVFAEQRALMIKKQMAYGPRNIGEFGEWGVLVRASDKLERLKHLMKEDRDPEWETVEDTWRDLLNYAAIALMWRRNAWYLPLGVEEDDGKGQ